MPYAQITYALNSGHEVDIDLGQDCGKVTVTTGAAGEAYLWIMEADSLAAAQARAWAWNAGVAADPTPAAGTSCTFLHLKPGQTASIGADLDGKGFVPGLQTPLRYIIGWAKASDDLIVVGH